MIYDTILQIMAANKLCLLSCNPYFDPLNLLNEWVLSLADDSMSVIIVTSSYSRACQFKSNIKKIEHKTTVEVYSLHDLRVSRHRIPIFRNFVLILDFYISSPRCPKSQVALQDALNACKYALIAYCIQPKHSIVKQCMFQLGLRYSYGESLRVLHRRQMIVHLDTFLRPSPHFICCGIKNYTAQPTSESVAMTKLNGMFVEIVKDLEQGKRICILSRSSTNLLRMTASRLLDVYANKQITFGGIDGTDSVLNSQPGTFWLWTYRKAVARLRDIERIGAQIVLLDMPRSSTLWINLNFALHPRSSAIRVMLDCSMREQMYLHRLNALIKNEVHNRKSTITRERISAPMAFTADVVQAIRFFIFLKFLAVKHGDLASAACRVPIMSSNSSPFLIDVLQRYVNSAIIFEKRTCKIAKILVVCASAEPRLWRWLLPTRSANISSSTFLSILGHVPPTEIQNIISSFIEEFPLDAMSILASTHGKSMLDRRDIKSFLAAVNSLPPYLQEHIILTYPYAVKFAQKHLRVVQA